MEAVKEQQSGTTFKCHDCGAKLTYKPGTQHISCEYCGAENHIDSSDTPIEEQDFFEHLEASASEPKFEGGFVDCNTCGASSSVEAHITSASCPYCDTPFVLEAVYQATILKPKSLIPFQVSKEQAVSKFKEWIGKSWFTPNDLKKASLRFEQFKGVYVPYWTYDADFSTDYSGARGDYYFETKTVKVGDKTTTQQVRKTRWTPTSGNVTGMHDDLLVVASPSLPEKYVQKLEPWDLSQLVSFDNNYLSGFIVEKYQLELDAGFETAKEIGKDEIRSMVKTAIGGDTQRVASMNTQYSNIKFKHLLLPVFICAYHFKGETFRFLVNGQTGEVQGEKPKSWAKILLVILAILAVIGVGVWIYYWYFAPNHD